MITIRPEPVFRAALSSVKGNAEVRQLLGGSIKSGQLRAYVLRRGTFGLNATTRKLEWLPPRVQVSLFLQLFCWHRIDSLAWFLTYCCLACTP